MCLGDVDDKKICHTAEVLDELLELLKFVHKRWSGTTSKTQYQRSITCKKTKKNQTKKTPQNLGNERYNWIVFESFNLYNAPFKKLQMLVFSPFMVTTGVSGAFPPSNAS